MTVIAPTIETALSGDSAAIRVTWANMANGDTGAPFNYVAWADRSIQVTGTFGAGGNMRWQGSNDGTNYAVLTDPQGNDLNISSAKIEAVTEIAAICRPNVTAGDGTTSLTVTLVARRADGHRGR